MASMMEAPHQKPQQFMCCGELIERDYYITKIYWLRCVPVEALCGAACMPLLLTKQPRGARKGEFDFSGNEQVRVFNTAWLG